MSRGTLLSVGLVAVASVCACKRPTVRAPKAVLDSPELGWVSGTRDRTALVGSSHSFGATRPALVEALKQGAVFLEIHDATHAVSVELPSTPTLDDVTSVVVVRIDTAARYGTMKFSDTVALEAVARGDAASGAVVLLRVADHIPLEQVIAATDALKRAGIGHVVLGLVPAHAAPPEDAWGSCPFPAASDRDAVDSGLAMLSVSWDDQGRPGLVRVLESSGHAFGGAAVLCALWQRNTSTGACSGDRPLPCEAKVRVRFSRSAP